MSLNRTIGIDGRLPWPSIPEDFAHFKRLTMGRKIIVGRKTYETLPPLKGREIHIVTRQIDLLGKRLENGEYFSFAKFFGTQDFLDQHNDSIVCGGAQVYSALLSSCSTLYLTEVKQEFMGDTFMPPFEHMFAKKEILHMDGICEISRYEKI